MVGESAPPFIMTDSEIQKFIDFFGDSLPNPEHQPKQFMWYVKLWRFYNDRNN